MMFITVYFNNLIAGLVEIRSFEFIPESLDALSRHDLFFHCCHLLIYLHGPDDAAIAFLSSQRNQFILLEIKAVDYDR